MFKAKLISDFNHYRLFRNGMVLAFLYIPFAIAPNLLPIPIWILPACFFFIMMVYPYLKKYREQFEGMSSLQRIEMDADEIRIIDKHQKVARIPIDKLDKITVRESYQIPGDTLRSFFNEIKGKQHKNFIIIEQAGKRQRFDFVIASYYAIEQIKKVTDKWTAKNLLLEKI